MVLRSGVTLLIILTAIIRLKELTSSITLIMSTLRRIVANAIIAILSLLRLVHSLASAGCGVTVVRNVLNTTGARAGAGQVDQLISAFLTWVRVEDVDDLRLDGLAVGEVA